MPTVPASTLDGLESGRRNAIGLWTRRGFLTLLVAVLLLGLLGFLGVRAGDVSAQGDGWSLQLRYARTARAGLDVPFTATVRHPGGFPQQITLALTGDYLDIYETQGFHPDADSATRDGTTLYLTFTAPTAGDTFVVTYDAYIQPAAQIGRSATLSVMADGRPAATVHLTTHLLP